MKKILLTETQLDLILNTELSEAMLLEEGKFSDSVNKLATNYYPSFLEKITSEELTAIEQAFVKVHEVSTETRRWIITMIIKGQKDKLLSNLDAFAKAIKDFVKKKAIVAQNGDETMLVKGQNEKGSQLVYDDVETIINATLPVEARLAIQSAKEGDSEILYQDSDVLAIRFNNPSETQARVHDKIGSWCTKTKTGIDGFVNRRGGGGNYLITLIDKNGVNPFGKKAPSEEAKFAGRMLLYLRKNLNNDEWGNMITGNNDTVYADDYDLAQFRNKLNELVPLNLIFNHYNPQLFYSLIKGVTDFLGKYKGLFWYEYTDNDFDKHNLPAKFLSIIQQINNKFLAEQFKKITGQDGEVNRVQDENGYGGSLKFQYSTNNGTYVIDINQTMKSRQSKYKKNALTPRNMFIKMMNRRQGDEIITYQGIELINVTKPETFIEYIDINKLAEKTPALKKFAPNLSPKMLGQAAYSFYTKQYPNSSPLEIYEAYFRPFLDYDKMYQDYFNRKKEGEGNEQPEDDNMKMDVPIFKHELSLCLFRNLSEVEDVTETITVPIEKN